MRDRREFLRLTGLGAMALGIGAARTERTAIAAGQADVLLLSCMDYRLVDVPESYMASHGMKGKYDHVILAGAALGAITNKYPEWNKTFWDHLDVAIQLHGISKVVIIDHRDCGAYKVILGEDFSKDPAKETAIHASTMHTLRDQIKAKHPSLGVELLLLSLKGTIEPVQG